MTLEQRRRATWGGLILLGMVAGLVLSLKHVGIELPRWADLGLLGVVLLVGGVSTFSWWKLLDEVAREAHKFAWFWGGSAGILVSGVCMLLVERDSIPIPLAMGGAPSDIFAAGAITVLLSQIVGYLVAWAGWWWARR